MDHLDGPLTPEQERQVAFIQEAAGELSTMVDDLLDLAKVEAGRITISPDWFELIDLFSALRGMFRPIATSGEVTVVFEDPVDVPRMYSDNQKVAQILRNFISNAYKFTEHGSIVVSAKREEGDMVRFSVHDTGIGIAPNDLASLFEDFVQLAPARARNRRGTDLDFPCVAALPNCWAVASRQRAPLAWGRHSTRCCHARAGPSRPKGARELRHDASDRHEAAHPRRGRQQFHALLDRAVPARGRGGSA